MAFRDRNIICSLPDTYYIFPIPTIFIGLLPRLCISLNMTQEMSGKLQTLIHLEKAIHKNNLTKSLIARKPNDFPLRITQPVFYSSHLSPTLSHTTINPEADAYPNPTPNFLKPKALPLRTVFTLHHIYPSITPNNQIKPRTPRTLGQMIIAQENIQN